MHLCRQLRAHSDFGPIFPHFTNFHGTARPPRALSAAALPCNALRFRICTLSHGKPWKTRPLGTSIFLLGFCSFARSGNSEKLENWSPVTQPSTELDQGCSKLSRDVPNTIYKIWPIKIHLKNTFARSLGQSLEKKSILQIIFSIRWIIVGSSSS